MVELCHCCIAIKSQAVERKRGDVEPEGGEEEERKGCGLKQVSLQELWKISGASGQTLSLIVQVRGHWVPLPSGKRRGQRGGGAVWAVQAWSRGGKLERTLKVPK